MSTYEPITPEFQRLISASRVRLRSKSAFFATLLLHADILPSREVVGAATDGERVYVNPEVATSLPPNMLDGLLLHEVLHAALSHVDRRGPREKKRWNRAADTIVHGMVAAAELPLPPDAHRDYHLEQLSVEEVYTSLEAEMSSDDAGEGDEDLLDAPPSDVPPKSGRSNRDVSREWQQAMAQARSMDALGGGHGHDPLGAHRDLLRLAPARLDWRAQLWRYLVRTAVDFGGFDRRFVGRGLYLEALDDESMTVMVAIDTSGSVDDEAVKVLVSEVQGVLGAYPHVKAILYFADTEAYGPHELGPGDDIPDPQGGGGTDFRPIFKLLPEHEPDVLVYMTDGYGDFPEEAPKTPVLWVVSPGGLEDEGFPFGDILRLED